MNNYCFDIESENSVARAYCTHCGDIRFFQGAAGYYRKPYDRHWKANQRCDTCKRVGTYRDLYKKYLRMAERNKRKREEEIDRMWVT